MSNRVSHMSSCYQESLNRSLKSFSNIMPMYARQKKSMEKLDICSRKETIQTTPGQNTLKSPWDPRGFAVTETRVKGHKLMLAQKYQKECSNNIYNKDLKTAKVDKTVRRWNLSLTIINSFTLSLLSLINEYVKIWSCRTVISILFLNLTIKNRKSQNRDLVLVLVLWHINHCSFFLIPNPFLYI